MVAVTSSISPEWPLLGGLPKLDLITDHLSLIPLLLGTLMRHKSASTLPCLLHSTAVKSCLCGISASPPAEPSAAAPLAHHPHISGLKAAQHFSLAHLTAWLSSLFCLKHLCAHSFLCQPPLTCLNSSVGIIARSTGSSLTPSPALSHLLCIQPLLKSG